MTRAKDISKIVTDANLSGTLDVTGDLTVDTNTLHVDSANNRVGVGTSSPASSLHIQSSIPILRLTDSDTGSSHELSGQSGAGNLNIKCDTGGTTGSPVFNISMQDSTKVSVLNNGNVGIGTTSPNRMLTLENGDIQIHDTSTGDPLLNFSVGGTQASPTQSWTFRIDNSDSDKFQLMDVTDSRIVLTADGSGNVGIGTSSPSRKLHVGGTGSGQGELHLTNDTTGHGVGDGSTFTTSGSDLLILQRENANTRFYTNGSERMRIDSSGNLLVGKTSTGAEIAGITLGSSGYASFTRDDNVCLFINRENGDGDLIEFRKDNALKGRIYINGSGSEQMIGIGAGQVFLRFQNSDDTMRPSNNTGANADNVFDFGASNARFDDIFATNGTIQTSDRNEKQDIEELSDAEQRVAVVAKGLMRKFRWIDSVAEKGDNARTHFGIIAQDLQDAFTAEGLDAGDYAMFTSNTWWEKEISVDAVEADEENGIEAKDAYTYMDTKEEATEGYTEKTRLGVRYNQLLAFIISAI